MNRIFAGLCTLPLVACGGLPPRFPDKQAHDQPDAAADACNGGKADACYRTGERWGGFAPDRYPKSRRDQPFAGGMLEKGCDLDHGGCCRLLADLVLNSTFDGGPYRTRDGINFALDLVEKGCELGDLESCVIGQRLRSPSSAFPAKADRELELKFAKRGCALGAKRSCAMVKGESFVSNNFDKIADAYMRAVKTKMPVRKMIRQWATKTPTDTTYSQAGTVSVIVWDPSKQLRKVCFAIPEKDPLAKVYGGKRDQKACTSKSTTLAGGVAVGGQLPFFLRPGETRELQIKTTPSDLKVVISIFVPQ